MGEIDLEPFQDGTDIEELMAQLEAIPSNKRILKQIGVRESIRRCLTSKSKSGAEYEMKDPRILALVCSLWGWEMRDGSF